MWFSYSSSQFGEPSNVAGIQDLGLGYSAEELESLRVQDIGEGEVTIRLYEGRVVQGPLRGTQAVFKVCIEFSLYRILTDPSLPQTPHSAGSLWHWVRPFYRILTLLSSVDQLKIVHQQNDVPWKFVQQTDQNIICSRTYTFTLLILVAIYDGTFLCHRYMNILTILYVLRHRIWNKGIPWSPCWCFWSWFDGIEWAKDSCFSSEWC